MDLKGRKVYISGKITGEKGYIYRFAEAEHKLTKLGADAVNPARVNAELPKDTDYRQYMRMCLVMLFDCDAVLMLDNWKDSPGATAELYMARALGMTVYYDGREAIEQELTIGDVTARAKRFDVSETGDGGKEADMKDGSVGEIFNLQYNMKAIADHYGLNEQQKKTVEELAELIRAIAKGDLKGIAEETADVEIMLYQLKYLTGTAGDVEWIKTKKVKRTLERIAEQRQQESKPEN